MNRRSFLNVAAAMGPAFALSRLQADESAASIYVHPQGSDGDTGTKERPLQTLGSV